MSKRSKNKKRAYQEPKKPAPAQKEKNLPIKLIARYWKVLLQALLIVSAGAWLFSPALSAPFFGDDDVYLFNNALLLDPDRLWKAWFEPGSFIEYYPLEQTVQWCQYELWGLHNTLGYHLTNLVLHIVSALLLWYLLSKFGLKLAWLGGLIFVIHPMMVDTVAVACELKSTLSLPPFLLAMCFYLDYAERKRGRDYWLALGLFLVAMLCKITMTFFPIIILVHAWWKNGRITLRDLWVSAPFFIISLVLGWTTVHAGVVYAAATHYVSPGPIYLGGFFSRAALVGLTLNFYLAHCFFPVLPMPFYPQWQIDPPSLWQFLFWLPIALIIYCCWLKRQSWGRHITLGLLFFTLGLLPLLGVMQTSYMCLLWVEDHFLYIPIIGIIALIVAGLDHGMRQLPKKIIPPCIGAIILVMALYAFQTYSYEKLFSNPVQLWTYNLQYNPDMWMLRYFSGNFHLAKGDAKGAIEQLEFSLKINPDFPNTYLSLGQAFDQIGKTPEAIDSYEKILKITPENPLARYRLSYDFILIKRYPEAIEQLERILQTHPNFEKAHYALGVVLEVTGRESEAMEHYENALDLVPNDVDAQNCLVRVKNFLASTSTQK